MFEAREFLRKKIIGKKVDVIVDYIQEKSDDYPEKICCTINSGGMLIFIYYVHYLCNIFFVFLYI